MYTANQKKAQTFLEKKINTQYVVKYAMYNLCSAVLGRLQMDMSSIVTIPYTHCATRRLDLVSVRVALCQSQG